MSAEYATFGLAPAMRAGGVLSNGDHQVHRDFVDFVVDGRPLLFRLSDLDAVSPLAADVPPAIFTAQVRGLLLETGAPLPGGRYIVYGCPECEDLACGAVTAVIEHADPADGPGGDGASGGDYVWRDFAWQTGETVDLRRDGYHGIGPFRFHGDTYRAALRALLADPPAGTPAMPAGRRRVLLIGPRVAVLARLAAALRTIGVGAEITRDTVQVSAAELRTYGAVVFGPAVPAQERRTVRAAFERAGADAAYVDALAPIVPLLVAQTEHALDRSPVGRRRLTRLVAAGGAAGIEITSTCRVRLTAYGRGPLSRTRVHEIFDGVLPAGQHRIAVAPSARGAPYLVARTSGTVLVQEMTR